LYLTVILLNSTKYASHMLQTTGNTAHNAAWLSSSSTAPVFLNLWGKATT